METNDARLVTVSLLKINQSGEYDKMSLYYSNDFYRNITEEQWVNNVKQINSKVGKIESYNLIETEIINENNNLLINLTYKVHRAGHDTEERFGVICSENSTKVIAHNIKI
jgi:hypothetical protein